MATIIDVDTIVKRDDRSERLERMIETKELQNIATVQVDGNENEKKPPNIKLSSLKKAFATKPRPKGRKPPIDWEKTRVREYQYTEFSKVFQTIIPNVVNMATFNDDKLKLKLTKSKDLKHVIDEKLVCGISNDYIGGGLTVSAILLDHWLEKMGVDMKPPKPQPKKEKDKEDEVEDHVNINIY
jgi:hypothetical protein